MEEVKEEQKPEVMGDSKETEIRIIVSRTPTGIDCRLSEDSALPMNDVYIRGIFDKAKDIALGCFMNQVRKEMMKKPKILVPGGNPLVNGLKKNYRKMLGG